MITKICSICSKELPATLDFFYKNDDGKYHLHSVCKECRKSQYINNKLDILYKRKEYYEDNRDEIRQKQRDYWKIYYLKNREKILSRNKRYKKTENGMIIAGRAKNKRRNMGYIELTQNPFDDDVEIHWHHFLGAYVVAIPKDIHQLYSGYNREKHRDLCMNIVKQIYPLDD